GGLHVAMDDALSVREGERAADLAEDDPRQVDVELSTLDDHRLQRPALDVFHDEVHERLRLLDAEDLDDVRVAQCRRRLCFALEPVDHARLRDEIGEHGLDGDLAIQRQVERQIDGGHAAPSELTVDVIVAEGRVLEDREERIDLLDAEHGGAVDGAAAAGEDAGDRRTAVWTELGVRGDGGVALWAGAGCRWSVHLMIPEGYLTSRRKFGGEALSAK